MQLTKFLESFIRNSLRVIKVQSNGKSQARTGELVQAFGEDSNPVGWKPIFAKTQNESEPIVIGFINPSVSSELGKGAKELFSTDEEGNKAFYFKMNNDGTAELGGDADYLVRYNELEKAFDKLKEDFNSFVTEKYNLHAHIANAQGSPTNATTSTGTVSTADISKAKIEEIKTIGNEQ